MISIEGQPWSDRDGRGEAEVHLIGGEGVTTYLCNTHTEQKEDETVNSQKRYPAIGIYFMLLLFASSLFPIPTMARNNK